MDTKIIDDSMRYNVLVIGSGGREHAIAWKLAQSPQVRRVFVAPGNPGASSIEKVSSARIEVNDTEMLINWCKKNEISLVAVGPENLLDQGLSDALNAAGVHCFGPSKNAALIESDKEWSKLFMDRYDIPTAKWRSFRNPEEAKKFINQKKPFFEPLVIKAAGLAKGKGVIVASNSKEADRAAQEMLVDKKYGSAGKCIIVEEPLQGIEVSVHGFSDGKTVVPILPSQDHKRLFDKDYGPNTGGMGAYCPCEMVTQEDYDIIVKDILQKAIDSLRIEKNPFVGVLYAGLMLTEHGPKVLEFNCRFGDPETQVILPLLKSDLFLIMKACCEGDLKSSLVIWEKQQYAVGITLASRGYPINDSPNEVISGVNDLSNKDGHIVFHCGTKIGPAGELLSNGGRIMCAVSLGRTLLEAAGKAMFAAKTIKFNGKQFRTDIAHKGIIRSILNEGKLTYKSSGVDINEGEKFISSIKSSTSSTHRAGTMGPIGSFGGLFDLKAAKYVDPILVSGTDGIGTKLTIAFECDKHDTIGIDVVAMCVNDVLAHGAEPLFFLDYFACGKLDIDVANKVIKGVAEGCRRAGCSLIGGETAEMPDMYPLDEYDLAGFAVGAVEKTQLLPRINDIEAGDVVIGLPSSGLHSNGFSLVRKVMKLSKCRCTDVALFDRSKTYGEVFLEPTKIYVQGVLPAIRTGLVKAFAHITGGGLVDNIPRVLPKELSVVLDVSTWYIPPVFAWLAAVGSIQKNEMLKTFNCGIGAVIICAPHHKDAIFELIQQEYPIEIGRVVRNKDTVAKVVVKNFEKTIAPEMKQFVNLAVSRFTKPLKRVAVLISGSGTNLQALIDACQDESKQIGAEIVLVVSNVPDVEGLKRAAKAQIPFKVVKNKDYVTRKEFDSALSAVLEDANIDIVCLAGFMRILSASFVLRWLGALINIHPALLPSFKGMDAHEQVLASGVRVSGCTVHFVDVEVDAGPIIAQGTVQVHPKDTVKTLKERVKEVEHAVYPIALRFLATEQVEFNKSDKSLKWNL